MASIRSCCHLLLLMVGAIAVFQPRGAEAQLGNIIVSGVVPCGAGSAAAFPNATVVLKCGSKVLASATTTVAGAFKLELTNVLGSLISTLLNECVMAVVTPLTACGGQLPTSGILQAPLELLSRGLLGGVLGGLLGNIGVGDFTSNP